MSNAVFDNALKNAHKAGLTAAFNVYNNYLSFSGLTVTNFGAHTDEGHACGFAWIVVPGNSAFGRYVKKIKVGYKGYPCGIHIWVSLFGQSVMLKEAYASAYAKSLQVELGMTEIYSASRLD